MHTHLIGSHMKYIIIATRQADAIDKIRSSFTVSSEIKLVKSVDAILSLLSGRRYDIVFIDIHLLGPKPSPAHYAETIQSFKKYFPTIEIVVMTPRESIREAVKAVKSGASDYVTYPVDPEEVRYVVDCIRSSMIVQSELDYLRGKFWHADSLEFVHTRNELMKQVYEKIRSVAPTKATVLVCGETGTGKGLIASLIHRHSNREDGRFISVHCGAIPDTLLESELFGHEKGAFTGAVKRKLGKFEIARGGTIFLDEIGTISASAQIKLLQILQDGMFTRVGGEDSLQTDARVIAATNADLKTMSENGAYRRDLYYRLNVFPIEIPPLRERIEDIAHLAGLLLKRFNAEMSKQIQSIHPEVTAAMQRYTWPGNIRELQNLMERAYILETSAQLTPASFPAELFEGGSKAAPLPADTAVQLAEARRRAVDDFERQYIRHLLDRNRGKINKSAEEAGITSRQLHKLMARYGFRKEDFKS